MIINILSKPPKSSILWGTCLCDRSGQGFRWPLDSLKHPANLSPAGHDVLQKDLQKSQ